MTLIGWGTLVGLDLVTVPQALLSRPLVAAAGAGLLLGDVRTGLEVGMVLELFALDVLPAGAARYPDFGAASIGAVVLAAGHRWQDVLGLATLFGLALSALGGWSLQGQRRLLGAAVRRGAASLATGDAATMSALQWRGFSLDVVRSTLLAALAVAAASLLRPHLPASPRFEPVTAVAVGCGLVAAAGGALRSAGRGARLGWLAGGFAAGFLLLWRFP